MNTKMIGRWFFKLLNRFDWWNTIDDICLSRLIGRLLRFFRFYFHKFRCGCSQFYIFQCYLFMKKGQLRIFLWSIPSSIYQLRIYPFGIRWSSSVLQGSVILCSDFSFDGVWFTAYLHYVNEPCQLSFECFVIDSVATNEPVQKFSVKLAYIGKEWLLQIAT